MFEKPTDDCNLGQIRMIRHSQTFSLTRLFRNGQFGEVLDIFRSYWVSFSFLSGRSGWSGIKGTINSFPRAMGNGILLARDSVRDTSQQRTRVPCFDECDVLKMILMVHPRYATIWVCAVVLCVMYVHLNVHLNVTKLDIYAYQFVQIYASTPKYKKKFILLLFQLIFLSSLSFIPIPRSPMLSGPVDAVTWYEIDLELTPHPHPHRKLVTTAAGRQGANQTCALGSRPGQIDLVSPGQRLFLPGPLARPLSYIPCRQPPTAFP